MVIQSSFIKTAIKSIESKQSNLCVGLDCRYDRIPDLFKKDSISKTILNFNQLIVNATAPHAAAYKINIAFYAGFGAEGLEGLRLTNKWIKHTFPDIPLLADCKRSEMGESVLMIKQEIFDWLNFDCVMVTPWFGFDTVRDYLDDATRGVCVYVHDSNSTASEFQDLVLKDGSSLYEEVAKRVSETWNWNGNVFVESGATYPNQLKRVRDIIGPAALLLTAGMGTQGAKIEDIRPSIFGLGGLRLLVNFSRAIIFVGNEETSLKSCSKVIENAANRIKQNLRKQGATIGA